MAGAGADAVFGDGGDDWIQGGSGQDLLIGDHGAPFLDDHAEVQPDHDVFIGQVGENDYVYTFQVRAVNTFGAGTLSASSNTVLLPGVPVAPSLVTAVAGSKSATLSWVPGAPGGSPITGYRIAVRVAGVTVRTDSVTGAVSAATVTGGLTNGTRYTFVVRAVSAAGLGAASAPSNAVVPRAAATVRGAPVIGVAASGPAGGGRQVVPNWSPPSSTGGSRISGYEVSALQMAADGVTPTGVQVVVTVGAAARTRTIGHRPRPTGSRCGQSTRSGRDPPPPARTRWSRGDPRLIVDVPRPCRGASSCRTQVTRRPSATRSRRNGRA